MKAPPAQIYRILLAIAAGVIGYLINLFPIEIFSGIHLIFGAATALVAAIALGPVEGGLAGLIAGLRTVTLWKQFFPASMLLYGLEGVIVGLINRRLPRVRTLVIVLLYWLLIGGWLNLAAQYYLFKLPFDTALIIQIRSVVNGLICGLLAEAAILVISLFARRRTTLERLRPVSMAAVISLFLTIGISLPILYASTSYARQVRERLLSNINELNQQQINSTASEVSGLVESYQRALELTASIIESEGRPEFERMQKILALTRQRYPVFAGLYIADMTATTIAFEPRYNEQGEYLVGLNYRDREYYRDLINTGRTTYSTVYRGRGGLSLPVVSIGVPLRDSDGQMWGFVLGWFDLRSFQALVRRHTLDTGAQLVITDHSGHLIADSLLTAEQQQEVQDYSNSEAFQMAARNREGSAEIFQRDAQQSVAAMRAFNRHGLIYTTINAPAWKIWINQSTGPVDQQIAGLYLKTIITVFILILLAAVFAQLVSQLMVGPIQQLQNSAKELAAGNFSSRSTISSAMTTEVSSLVTSFNQMATALAAAFDNQRALYEEISRRESELQNLIASAHDAICAVDQAGRIIWLNQRTAELLMMDENLLKDQQFESLLLESDRALAAEQLAKAFDGEPNTSEYRLQDRSGKLKDLLVTASPIRAEQVTGVLLIARDVTEQKEAKERARRADKLRAMGQLATGVAHNFNNALAAILGRAQLLKLKTNEPYFVSGLAVIERAALDGASMVKRIQTFSRRKSQEQFSPEDLNLLVQDAVELTRTRWQDDAHVNGLEYQVTVSLVETPVMVNAVASELREVFVNIIINALDAMSHGGSLQIKVTQQGELSQVTFSDSGMGMSAEVKEKLFEPFFTTKGMSGTGLGLSVSYGIISRHNGTITVDSELGKGTTFKIQLPCREAVEIAKPISATVAVKALKILVIDDEEMVRETLAEYLELGNHQVTAVGDDADWLELLKADRFDIVITDLSMPKVDGYHVALVVKQGWPQTRVLMATGYGDGIDRTLLDDGTIDDVISKPFNLAELNACLSKLMGS